MFLGAIVEYMDKVRSVQVVFISKHQVFMAGWAMEISTKTFLSLVSRPTKDIAIPNRPLGTHRFRGRRNGPQGYSDLENA